jgi:hypothetical protein
MITSARTSTRPAFIIIWIAWGCGRLSAFAGHFA